MTKDWYPADVKISFKSVSQRQQPRGKLSKNYEKVPLKGKMSSLVMRDTSLYCNEIPFHSLQIEKNMEVCQQQEKAEQWVLLHAAVGRINWDEHFGKKM